MTQWSIELLTRQHIRSQFDCGVRDLNEYLRRYARKNTATGTSRTFVATKKDSLEVSGYYSISAGSIRLDDLPEEARKSLPRYPVPMAHLGKLAVDARSQGQGLGAILLFDALARTARASEHIGIHAFTVIAYDRQAQSFYEHYGFVPLVSAPNHLFLPVQTVWDLLAEMDGIEDS